MVLNNCGQGFAKNSLGVSRIKINARTDESGESGDADDYVGVGGESAAIQILLHYEKPDEQADGYEYSVSA